MFYKKEYNELKKKVELFELMTNVPIDKWLKDLGTIEHDYHNKLSELKEREAIVKANESIIEQKIELAKAWARAEYEQKYNHELHLKAELYAKEIAEVAKIACNNKITIINPDNNKDK